MFTLINLVVIISDINMIVAVIEIYVLSTMVIESVIG